MNIGRVIIVMLTSYASHTDASRANKQTMIGLAKNYPMLRSVTNHVVLVGSANKILP